MTRCILFRNSIQNYCNSWIIFLRVSFGVIINVFHQSEKLLFFYVSWNAGMWKKWKSVDTSRTFVERIACEIKNLFIDHSDASRVIGMFDAYIGIDKAWKLSTFNVKALELFSKSQKIAKNSFDSSCIHRLCCIGEQYAHNLNFRSAGNSVIVYFCNFVILKLLARSELCCPSPIR